MHIADYTDHEEVIREATRVGTASSLLPTDTDMATDLDLNTGIGDDSGMKRDGEKHNILRFFVCFFVCFFCFFVFLFFCFFVFLFFVFCLFCSFD
jgi:hypothetical protein